MPAFLLSPWFWLVAALAMAGAAAGGWRAHTIYDKAEERDRLAGVIVQMQVDQNEAKQISQDVQAALAGQQVVNRTIVNEVQREIIEKPVYRDPNCGLPDTGRLRLDTAIDAANRTGRLDAAVPRPAEAGGQSAR